MNDDIARGLLVCDSNSASGSHCADVLQDMQEPY